MIFSVICEELGLGGAVLLMLVFGLLLWRLCVNAMHGADLAGMLICGGIMGHLAIQVVLSSHQYHSQYRDHVALYQLWRNFRSISAGGDGAGTGGEQSQEGHLCI